MKKTVVTPFISAEALTSLSARLYEKSYTEIPNVKLGLETREAIAKVFAAVNGAELDIEGTTFMVRAKESGELQSIISPSVYRAATFDESGEATPENYLVIRWGDSFIPVDVTADGFSFPNAPKGVKLEAKLSTEKTNGKYENTCLVVTLKNTKEKKIISIQFPIRSIDYQNPVDPDVADTLIEEGSVTEFLDYIQNAPNPNATRNERSSGRLEGYFVKVANLPEGEYTVTEYREKTGGKYGTDYFIQALIPEPIEGVTVSQPAENLDTFSEGKTYSMGQSVIYNGIPYTVTVDSTEAVPGTNGDWESQEGHSWVSNVVTLSDKAILRPNSKLKRFFAARPLITPEAPATLRLHSHGEYNGHPTVKAELAVTSYETEENGLDLNF